MKTGTIDCLKRMTDYFENLPKGKEVTLYEVQRDLGLGRGQWKAARSWIDAIIYIQNSKLVKRKFSKRGHKQLTKYSVSEEKTTENDLIRNNLPGV